MAVSQDGNPCKGVSDSKIFVVLSIITAGKSVNHIVVEMS